MTPHFLLFRAAVSDDSVDALRVGTARRATQRNGYLLDSSGQRPDSGSGFCAPGMLMAGEGCLRRSALEGGGERSR